MGTFCIFFTIELVLRAAHQRKAFLWGLERYWNAFDTLVVVSSIFEVCTDLMGVKVDLGMSTLRTLRVARIIRVLRSGTVYPILRNLKTMLYSLVGSGTSFVA